MTMRTWMMGMTVVSAVGFLALGTACEIKECDPETDPDKCEPSGSGGSGGMGTGGMGTGGMGTGGSGGGASATCDANTCGDALNVEKPAKDVVICAADPMKPTTTEQAHIDALKAVFTCICEAAAAGGVCGDKCAVPGKDANGMDTTNTCDGKAPSVECTACIGDPMAGCQAQIDACVAVK